MQRHLGCQKASSIASCWTWSQDFAVDMGQESMGWQMASVWSSTFWEAQQVWGSVWIHDHPFPPSWDQHDFCQCQPRHACWEKHGFPSTRESRPPSCEGVCASFESGWHQKWHHWVRCLKERPQPTRLPTAKAREYDFSVVIGIDLLFVYGANPKEAFFCKADKALSLPVTHACMLFAVYAQLCLHASHTHPLTLLFPRASACAASAWQCCCGWRGKTSNHWTPSFLTKLCQTFVVTVFCQTCWSPHLFQFVCVLIFTTLCCDLFAMHLQHSTMFTEKVHSKLWILYST